MESQADRREVKNVAGEEGIEYAFLPDCMRCKYEGSYYWWAVNIPDSVKRYAMEHGIKRYKGYTVSVTRYNDEVEQYWDSIFEKCGYPKNFPEYSFCPTCFDWVKKANPEVARKIATSKCKRTWYGEPEPD